MIITMINLNYFALFAITIQFFICSIISAPSNFYPYLEISDNNNLTITPKLWLTISAKNQSLEISWNNARLNSQDLILITNQEPLEFRKVNEFSNGNLDDIEGSGSSDGTSFIMPISSKNNLNDKNQWICNGDTIAVITVIIPREINGWMTTTINFDYKLSRNITINTKCYGYWASYITKNGKIITKNCISAYPKWMNEMKSAISDFRVRDLFIPGTHDSGSYRIGFDPIKKDTLVTKYSLTQDDDIYGQLMHGARYIDLRIGFYRGSSDKFFVNHGISRQRPLNDVLNQIIDFVKETNEIVIVDIQEFPVGFGKDLDVHKFLVHFLMSKLENYLVDPTLTWQITLRDIWRLKKNIILGYDNHVIVNEFPTVLFTSVQQRWGNVRTLKDLEEYLRIMNARDTSRLSSRPVADMAELTPDTWGVISDKYGGLRKLADLVNYRISELYMNDFGQNANIVAVDFIRGTTIVEAALYWNSKKVVTFR